MFLDPNYTTTELETIAFGAQEALDALDALCERRAIVPDEVYQARESLRVVAASLNAMVRSR